MVNDKESTLTGCVNRGAVTGNGAATGIGGVAEPDNGMEYPTMIYDGAFSDARRFGEPKALGTEVIDGAKAIELAKSYVGEQRRAPNLRKSGTRR